MELVILQTSDIHGHVLPIQYGTNEREDLGIAKIATMLKQEEEKSEHVLKIDNGDLIQGSPLLTYYMKYERNHKNPMIAILNHLKYDGAVVGNHEFNYGRVALEEAVAQSDFPWLCANILEKEKETPFLGTPYIIKEINGVKVAVLGVTTHYIPNWEEPAHIEKLVFADALKVTEKWVTYIREHEKPHLLVVSYHGGFERDLKTGEATETLTGENQAYEMCQHIKGIDVLLTGHQHRSLAGEVNGVTIVQPSFFGQEVGKVVVKFEKEEEGYSILKKESMTLSTKEIIEDEEIVELVRYYEEGTQKWLDERIGTAKESMKIDDVFQARIKEHPLIEFINKVQMYASGAQISCTALFNDSVKGFDKEITMRDIVSNYIYPNTLKVIRITGADMKAALERSASYFALDENGELTVSKDFSYPKPQAYNYDMWEGIQYKVDVSKKVGERIVFLEKDGAQIDEEAFYEIVTNAYRAGGGGDYEMFKNKDVVRDITVAMTDLIAEYITTFSPINVSVNHNWEVVASEKLE